MERRGGVANTCLALVQKRRRRGKVVGKRREGAKSSFCHAKRVDCCGKMSQGRRAEGGLVSDPVFKTGRGRAYAQLNN